MKWNLSQLVTCKSSNITHLFESVENNSSAIEDGPISLCSHFTRIIISLSTSPYSFCLVPVVGGDRIHAALLNWIYVVISLCDDVAGGDCLRVGGCIILGL